MRVARAGKKVSMVVGLVVWMAVLLLLAPARGGWMIETVAGTGSPQNNGDQGAALALAIGEPFGVEIGPDSALYITEVRHHRVRRLDFDTRKLTTVAGNGTKGYAGDGGAANSALLNEPYEARFDRAGNMFFVEMKNHLIRKVDKKTGVISTVAGDGQAGFAGDNGPAKMARFSIPHSIALDENDHLYVADIGNHRLRRIDANTGIITTILGTSLKRLPQSGKPAAGQPVLGPRAIYIAHGQLWLALREGNSIWRIDLKSGIIHHIAGTGKKGYTGDGGDARKATFDGPKGIVVGTDQTIYVVDTENQAIRRIDAKTNIITTIAGSGPKSRGFSVDRGPATHAKLNRPHGIGISPDGTLYIGDSENHRVRRVWLEPRTDGKK